MTSQHRWPRSNRRETYKRQYSATIRHSMSLDQIASAARRHYLLMWQYTFKYTTLLETLGKIPEIIATPSGKSLVAKETVGIQASAVRRRSFQRSYQTTSDLP